MENIDLKDYRVALYCRLSIDDKDKQESMSISGQKAFLTNFAECHGAASPNIYVDDGYSGMNFNRPGFRQILADIENGKINCIITKDMSRLGRNYIETGYYTEVYFPDHNVRYIAVNDGVDSDNSASLDITPIKNLINEYYIRDFCKKARTGKITAIRKGKYIFSTIPLGYDKTNDGKLVINEEQAKSVRRIFDLALQGFSCYKIAKIMEEEKWPRPSFYSNRYRPSEQSENNCFHWYTKTIFDVLWNPLYKGDLKVLKPRNDGSPVKHSYNTKSEIVPNSQPAIVSPDEWDKVQDIIASHQKHNGKGTWLDNCFKNVIFCADCGKRMSFQTCLSKLLPGEDIRNKTYYKCSTYRIKGKNACSIHTIKFADLEKIVLAKLKVFVKETYNEQKNMIDKLVKEQSVFPEIDFSSLDELISNLKDSIKTYESKYITLYDKFSDGLITKEAFKTMAAEYDSIIAALKADIEKYENLMSRRSQIETTIQQIIDSFDELDNLFEIEHLTTEIVETFIDKIIISEYYYDENGERHQEVQIIFKM